MYEINTYYFKYSLELTRKYIKICKMNTKIIFTICSVNVFIVYVKSLNYQVYNNFHLHTSYKENSVSERIIKFPTIILNLLIFPSLIIFKVFINFSVTGYSAML